MSWNQLSIKVPDVGTDGIAGIIGQIKSAIETLTSILKTILKVTSGIADPLSILIKSLIEQLQQTVESFLEDYGAYTLYVPIRKRLQTNFLGLGDITPTWAGELGIFGSDASQVSPSNPELNEFLVMANRYAGGNAGFFQTVVESLYDRGDANRPQFLEEEDYVGGVVLVMGTAFDPLGLLDDIWTLGGLLAGPDTVPKAPRPQNLKARALEGIGNGEFSTLLTWDAPETPITALPDLGGIILIPERYAILRGRNTVGALSATSVVDLMGKRDISVGDTFSNSRMEVILEEEYDITKASYLDEKITANSDDAFYYAVAWKLKAYGASESIDENTGTVLDYWYVSNIARVVPYPTLQASTAPDWRRTSSVADLFPAFASLLRTLVAQLEAFIVKTTSPVDALSNYVKFLQSEVARYEALSSRILDDVARMKAAFTMPQAGVYLRTFQGRGGNDFFLTDLANSFLSGCAGRPPFIRGTEYVTGVIILAGGPKLAVDGLLTGLDWVLGTKSSTSDAHDAMLEQLGKTVEAIEEQFFGDDMQPADPPPPGPDTSFDLAMNPLSRQEETPVSVEFGPNMEPL
jgi:hypothetical protein